MPRTAATEEKMARIVNLLRAAPAPMSAKDIADCSLIPANHVSALCSQLRDDGTITRADSGGRRIRALWKLTENTNGESQKEGVDSQPRASNDGEEPGKADDDGQARPTDR